MSLCVLVLMVALMGCEQVEPGASGTITLDPTVDRSEFDTLRISAVEDRFGEDTPVIEQSGPPRRITTQIDLDAVDFPHDYTVGGGIGDPTTTESWYVIARLVNADDVADQGPIGTADFIVPSDSCRGKFCGIAIDVDMEIEARVTPE
ncbi:MAG: hypothetical protein KUG77_30040 [Nannocystaceae bacterium]|nr:hypothetical protein [Nannocystaceae bacterium]